MDKKLVGAFVVTLTALVFTVSLSYYISTRSDQKSVPSPTPTPTPTGEEPANLTANIEELSFRTQGGLKLLIKGIITITGDQTAYNVKLRIQTWFSNGSKGLDVIEIINKQTLWLLPFESVNITGGDFYRLNNRWFPENLVVPVPTEFWLDSEGYVYPYDLIFSYVITPIWNDTP